MSDSESLHKGLFSFLGYGFHNPQPTPPQIQLQYTAAPPPPATSPIFYRQFPPVVINSGGNANNGGRQKNGHVIIEYRAVYVQGNYIIQKKRRRYTLFWGLISWKNQAASSSTAPHGEVHEEEELMACMAAEDIENIINEDLQREVARVAMDGCYV